MLRRISVLAALLSCGAIYSAAPAQTVSGCGTTAIPKADLSNSAKLTSQADCFGKAKATAAKAEEARRARLVAIKPTPAPTPTPVPTPTPAPTPVATWTPCAVEGKVCTPTGRARVRYGARNVYAYRVVEGPVTCSNAEFGDPTPSVVKACEYEPSTAALTGRPGGGATPAPAPPPVPVGPIPATRVGINPSGSTYYGSERIFANLAYQSGAWKDPAAGWGPMAAEKLSPAGYPLVPGALSLNPPQTVWNNQATTVTCTWKGKGAVRIDGDARPFVSGNSVTFPWPGFDASKTPGGRPNVLVYGQATDPSDLFRDLDCREPGLVTVGAFDKRLVDDMRAFAVLRFLDWSVANGPSAPRWDTRSTPDRPGTDGIAIEHMVDLANAADADPWFTIPLNADATYVRNMAALVASRMSTSHRAYFELSNETWNYAFPQATQLLNEGLALNLSTDRYTNNLYRYSQRSSETFKLLAEQFASNPARLVRVLNVQNGNPWAAKQILAFGDVAKVTDALASAPYFGGGLFKGATLNETDPAKLFAALEEDRVAVLGNARQLRDTAAAFGVKRYVTYEAGQHVIPPADKRDLAAQLQRDPRMGDLYRRYLADWSADIGDVITLYSSTGAPGQYGAWGMRDYPGQPAALAPKWTAVQEYLAAHPNR
jgi:hypothetical protein